MASPSPSPVRFPSGVSTDWKWGPLAAYGKENPFSYHTWADDFDILSASYTATKTGNGTIATLGTLSGGRLLFTTNSSTPIATDLCSIQLPSASFRFFAGKKYFFLTRLRVADSTNAGVRVGLVQTTVTPFTATDGLYFDKAAGATTWNLINSVGSVDTTLAMPASSNALFLDATDIDLGWFMNRNGEVSMFVGDTATTPLVGWVAESAGGNRGAVARFTPTTGTATMNFTVAMKSGTTASSTMTVDFAMAGQER